MLFGLIYLMRFVQKVWEYIFSSNSRVIHVIFPNFWRVFLTLFSFCQMLQVLVCFNEELYILYNLELYY